MEEEEGKKQAAEVSHAKQDAFAYLQFWAVLSSRNSASPVNRLPLLLHL
jgi:hypothetical protein